MLLLLALLFGPPSNIGRFDLKQSLDAQVQEHGSKSWRASLAVYTCSADSLLYGRSEDVPLAPASNQKLLVTACALDQWDSSLVRTLDAHLDSTDIRSHVHRVNRKFIDSLGLDARPEFPGYRHLVLANRESDNNEAQWMLDFLSRKDRLAGTHVVDSFLDQRGVARPGLKLADACGLSHRNRAASTTLAELLVSVYKSKWRDLFISTMAVPGRPGTLVKRKLDVGSHLAAKTGYIGGVFSLSGFLFGQTDTFAFSFILNGCGSGTRAYQLFNALLNTVYSWDAGETFASPAIHTSATDPQQN